MKTKNLNYGIQGCRKGMHLWKILRDQTAVLCYIEYECRFCKKTKTERVNTKCVIDPILKTQIGIQSHKFNEI